MRFEWDPAKDRTNRKKHGIGFEEAVSVFRDPLRSETVDLDHSGAGELRLKLTGRNRKGHLLTVIYTERGSDDESSEEKIRIISARGATRKERAAYEACFYDAGGGGAAH